MSSHKYSKKYFTFNLFNGGIVGVLTFSGLYPALLAYKVITAGMTYGTFGAMFSATMSLEGNLMGLIGIMTNFMQHSLYTDKFREFLNYKSVIPDNWETRIEVNKNNLQNSFERISLISASSVEKEKKYPVKINVDIGKVVISCTNQTGDAKEELFVSTEGKNLEAGFNPKYFLDSLKAIDDENVYVEFGTSISPCLIKSTENKDYVYMILPIRLKED